MAVFSFNFARVVYESLFIYHFVADIKAIYIKSEFNHLIYNKFLSVSTSENWQLLKPGVGTQADYNFRQKTRADLNRWKHILKNLDWTEPITFFRAIRINHKNVLGCQPMVEKLETTKMFLREVERHKFISMIKSYFLLLFRPMRNGQNFREIKPPMVSKSTGFL